MLEVRVVPPCAPSERGRSVSRDPKGSANALRCASRLTRIIGQTNRYSIVCEMGKPRPAEERPVRALVRVSEKAAGR
jgi:hypothetical protein